VSARHLALRELAGETFLAFGGPHGVLTMQSNALASNSLPRLNLVAAGIGIAVIPASMQRVTIEGVVYRRFTAAAGLHSPLNVISRKGDASAVVQQFLKRARRTAKDTR
jgi:DNA-binding transcriptional LysR family regulator